MGRQREKTRRDIAETARSIVEQPTGEELSGGPVKKPVESDEPDIRPHPRNAAAAALSKLGASKVGKARAEKLTAKRRKDIAINAAKI